jgi:hypothetical protein
VVVVEEEEEEEYRRWRSAEGEERRKAHHHGRRGDGYGACRRRCASRRNAGKSAPVGGGRLFDGASFESGVALERAEWRVALGERAEWRGVELPVPAVMLSGVDACVWIAWA